MDVQVQLFTDGNLKPGPCLGFVIRDEDGKILRQGSKRLAEDATNNVCEYSAVVAGLHNALLLGAKRVAIHADSQLIVNQCAGRWVCREPHLQEYLEEIREMVCDFDEVTFKWIPRAQNSHADAAARAAWN